MRLLYITYKVDSRDSLVGYVVGWINGLAAQMDRVEVICLAAGEAQLAPNVRMHSLGKGRGAGRAERAINFYRALWALRSSVDIVFCQFSPEYVLLVAPFAKWKRWPIALWYTHRHVSWRLRLATALADRIVTASPESFQLQSPKTRVIGHGIDTTRFTPLPEGEGVGVRERIILAVGRRSPIKYYELLIDAAQLLVRDFGWRDLLVRIVGGDEGGAPRGYAAQLQARIEKYGLKDTISLVGPVPFDQVAAEYQRAAVHVNLCPTGGMDKAVLEGMAVGVPTLVRNETFGPVLGELAEKLIVAGDDARAVAARLDHLLRFPDSERQALSDRLRQIVVEGYSQQALIEKLAGELRSLRR